MGHPDGHALVNDRVVGLELPVRRSIDEAVVDSEVGPAKRGIGGREVGEGDGGVRGLRTVAEGVDQSPGGVGPVDII